ncbi:hypothetical protein BD626DRAFT_399354 [Schizophyllum amplum]|uniref:Uncharacterized protein n=1 Tax=Schizophyllum amplum TaxID=97359 RepID=A0A550CKT9_9AGAR|nr:hypothetical protein BD626DRAFT_399354 [Auriculariopsis ampla]
MCFTAVMYRQYVCNHLQAYERHTADCNRTNCAISHSHSGSDHDCRAICDQRLMPQRDLVTEASRYRCDTCLARQ